MNDVFILQNQDKLFFGKQKDWLDGRDPGGLYKTAHKDEAINQMVEISAKDYTQRVKVLSCALNEKGLPLIDEAILPPPQPKVSRQKPVEEDDSTQGELALADNSLNEFSDGGAIDAHDAETQALN